MSANPPDGGRREEVTITLPKGFDPAKHQSWLVQKLSEGRGSGWRIELIDMARKVAMASRTLTLTQVQAVNKTTKVVTLKADAKPSDGGRFATQWAEQFPGFHMTQFEPHLGRARLTKLSSEEVHARNAVAEVMRVKPWEVQVQSRHGGGFEMELPPSYLPSKHDDRLNEVAESVVGQPGWYANFDGRTRKGAIIPSQLPTFPREVPHPLGAVIDSGVRTNWDVTSGDWGRIPLGLLLAGPGKPEGQVLRTDFEANPALQLSGIMGAGKGVFLNGLMTGAFSHGAEVGLVDAVKSCVDYTDFTPFLRPGFCAADLEQAVCVLQMAYSEGQRRKALIKKRRVQKFSQLPPSDQVRPLILIVDEATSLLGAEPVPKGLPKGSPLLEEIGERNLLRATALNLMSKIPRELRFVGVCLVLATQVASVNVGIPTELRANLPAKVLLGVKPTENNRKLALSNHDLVPNVPAYIADDADGAGRGVGVFEFQGRPPGIFKSFFSPPAELAAWLDTLGLPKCSDPTPTAEQMARWLPTLAPDESISVRSGADGGERSPSGRRTAQIRDEMGDDWDVNPETGERVTGFARANLARHVSVRTQG